MDSGMDINTAFKIETERKFLVNGNGFKAEAVASHRMVQGYICRESGRTVRVRIADDRAYLTIKGAGDASGMSRLEWEMEINVSDARQLLTLCSEGIIDKTRYIVPASICIDPESSTCPYGDRRAEERVWEIDEFYGDNEGLVMAEIELESIDERFVRPSWLGEEVTGDRRYYNSMLSVHPYSTWRTSDSD